MESLNNYFDSIYVINMDADKDRLIRVTEEFEAVNSTFKRVPGVVYGGGIKISDRVAGCYLSHITALKMAIFDRAKRVMICEDDLMIHPDLLTDAAKIVETDYDVLWINGYGREVVGDRYITPSSSRPQTHCYSVQNKLPEVLHHFEKHFEPLKILSPDKLFRTFPEPNIRHFTASKAYALQRAGMSVILKQEITRYRDDIKTWRNNEND